MKSRENQGLFLGIFFQNISKNSLIFQKHLNFLKILYFLGLSFCNIRPATSVNFRKSFSFGNLGKVWEFLGILFLHLQNLTQIRGNSKFFTKNPKDSHEFSKILKISRNFLKDSLIFRNTQRRSSNIGPEKPRVIGYSIEIVFFFEN